MKADNILLQQYLKRESIFKQKWVDFLTRKDLKINADTYFDKLTPLHGSDIYDSLTEKEKADSYNAYLQFIAEIQILIEKVVVFGFFKFRKHNAEMNDDLKRAMNLFLKEELYHTNGYTHFLSQQNIDSFFFMDRPLFRNLFAYFLNINPLCITLVGAKFEAFSIPYLQELKNSIKDQNDPWLYLNKIHMEDESFHVPLQFEFYNSSVKQYGFLRTIIPMAFLYILLELILLVGIHNLVKKVYKNHSFLRRNFVIYPKLIFWASRRMEAFQKSRQIMKNLFARKSPVYKRALKFIYA